MSFYDWGNPPINSTQTAATNPSSGAVLAEISTQALGGNYFFWVTVGASTLMAMRFEQLKADSTTASTKFGPVTLYLSAQGQSATYPFFCNLENGESVRVRADGAIIGTAQAFITGQRQT